MARRRIVTILVLTVALVIGYEYGHHRASRECLHYHAKSELHRDLDTASIAGSELWYLQGPKDAKSSRFMYLTFCKSVENANKRIAEGVTPFFPAERRDIQRGRELIIRYQLTECSNSVQRLLTSLEKIDQEQRFR